MCPSLGGLNPVRLKTQVLGHMKQQSKQNFVALYDFLAGPYTLYVLVIRVRV